MLRTSLVLLAVMAALPAAAQERGGVSMRDPMAIVDTIDANRGCPLSSTSVTVGVNKAFGTGSSAQQNLGTASGGSSGCRPLVSTQVVTGANLALGRGSAAGQSITAQGQRGALSTNTFTRGYNIGAGSLSTANQRLINQIGH
jgi:hypothetical protein